MASLGRHVLIDAVDVPAALLDDQERLLSLLSDACVRAGASVLRTVAHSFEPQGVTVLLLLAESHASIHTWPEKRAYCADVFTCGNVDPISIAQHVRTVLGGTSRMHMVARGDLGLRMMPFGV